MLAYDGTAFAGWWRQPNARTVAECIDIACARFGEPDARVVGVSRTDAGVHARCQVAHLDTTRDYEASRLLGILATHLPSDLACYGVAVVDENWHACYQAQDKTYRYTISNGEIPDPFMARFAWRPPYRLALDKLQAASASIAGKRDWRGFVKRGETRHHDGDLIRDIHRVTWTAENDLLLCHVTGAGFTYRLVRSLVGAMVAVAHGTCRQEDLSAALAGNTTSASAQQAPACGLCLHDVRYSPSPNWVRSPMRLPSDVSLTIISPTDNQT
jgi:tRNA pseudouridine38-40 synthase